MASLSHVLLFPHEHTDVSGALYDLSVRSKTRPRLRTFLAASSAVVHEQAVAVDGSERASIGPFEDLVDLAERHVSQRSHNVVVEMVLLTAIQLSQLLVYVRTLSKRGVLSENWNNLALGLLRTSPRSSRTHHSELASVLV